MTKKRWIVLAGILAACVWLALAVLALLPPRPGITPANIQRIEEGMTLAEVEEILGGPGVERWPRFDTHVVTWNHPHDETWVTVWLDQANRVTLSAPIPPETFMQKLKRLLRL